jgi:hypothetical protein
LFATLFFLLLLRWFLGDYSNLVDVDVKRRFILFFLNLTFAFVSNIAV